MMHPASLLSFDVHELDPQDYQSVISPSQHESNQMINIPKRHSIKSRLMSLSIQIKIKYLVLKVMTNKMQGKENI